MVLIERDEEIAFLEALLAGAVLGRGRIALVGGAVAAGKSALLHAFAEQVLELGALPLTAAASRLERDVPLGVLGQLIHDAPLVAEERERAQTLLLEGAGALMAPGSPVDTLRQVDARIADGLCTILLSLAQRYPLLLVVDDVDQADHASLLCLAYLARRVRTAPILAVFGHSEPGRHDDAFFRTELLRLPHCRRLRLTPLSRAGVLTVAARHATGDAAERLAEDWHAASGGNPLLVAALAEDHQDAVRSGERPPAGGDAYGRAVLSCLHRTEPRTREVARALAVLGEPGLIAPLLGVGSADAARELHVLTAAGLLLRGRFRHEAARAAVLAEMDATGRMELHRRAAELAHDAGAAPVTVAEHLLEAGPGDTPWAVGVLLEAAAAAQRAGRIRSAAAYLRLAWRRCDDEDQRTRIAMTLLRAEWRLDPGACAAHLTRLTAAARRGALAGRDTAALARALLWHGRFDDAAEVLSRLHAPAEQAEAGDGERAGEAVLTGAWLRTTHPPLHERLRLPESLDADAVVSVAAGRRLEAALALAAVLTRGPRREDVDAAERVLHGCRLDETSTDVIETALLALVYAGRHDRAAAWCELLDAEPPSRQSPARRARLAAVRAEIAVREGDMPAAERHARAALETISAESWGVAAGGPLSCLVIAATAMGRHDEVRDHLGRPVREALFQTRYGLHYLHARGRHSLATGYPEAALRDFRLLGELMDRWGLDVPNLIAWRLDAAEACLRTGRREEARRLAEDQLARCGESDARIRGAAVRLLAATRPPQQRPALLRQALDLLRTGGDRYELARALCDFTAAYAALGEDRRAAMIAIRARAAVRECRAEPLAAALPYLGEGGTGPAPQAGAAEAPAEPVAVFGDPAAVLSDAERRVAALAAAGYTNREIAARLYITVSTVEQHLTRTYRKLNITRRADLPSSLEFGDSAVA